MRVAFRKSECHPHREEYDVPFVLINMITEARAKIDGAIDTGFDGSLMVDSEIYSKLAFELSEKPESQFPAYRTLSGTAIFRSSSGRAVIAGKEIAVEVITPLIGGGKNLLGRRVMREFTTLLHTTEMFCMGEARVESGSGLRS